MKTIKHFALAVITILLAVGNTVAQNDADKVTPAILGTLTHPEPNDFKPVTIVSAEAFAEKTTNAREAGFSQAYFSENELNKLLGKNNAVGLRFYNGKSESGETFLIAAAVKSSGKEVNPIFLKNYVRSTNKFDSELISKNSAKKYVKNISNTKEVSQFSAFMGKTEIETLLAVTDASGLLILPGSRKFTDAKGRVSSLITTNIAAGTILNGQLTNIGDSFKKSLIPCPCNCPDDQYLLVPAASH